MGKNKLAKFAEMEQLPNVLQYPFGRLEQTPFPYCGQWHSTLFGNSNPIILELGCGRGEYTVGMARRHPECNYVAVDIKGNRMWTGATTAQREGLSNVRFLRTEIELITHFFGPEEVSEIWLTFPDPQMKKARLRLTSTRFLTLYSQIVRPGGLLHLKSDSAFLYTYTRAVAELNQLTMVHATTDVDTAHGLPEVVTDITTYYEGQWRKRGIPIKYICLQLPSEPSLLQEPDIEIEPDSYRSYNRNQRNELKIL